MLELVIHKCVTSRMYMQKLVVSVQYFVVIYPLYSFNRSTIRKSSHPTVFFVYELLVCDLRNKVAVVWNGRV